jgi:hypothetical protein
MVDTPLASGNVVLALFYTMKSTGGQDSCILEMRLDDKLYRKC